MNLMHNLRFKDYYNNVIKLDALTKFNLINSQSQINIKKVVLNFSFKDIAFNKKKVIPFFLALELITGQKGKLTLAKKPTMSLKIRKGTMVGCSITLHKDQLYKFYDYLLLALAKSENIVGFPVKKFYGLTNNTFSFYMDDLFNFYQIEVDIHGALQSIDLTILFNTFSIEEKVFLASSYKLPILMQK